MGYYNVIASCYVPGKGHYVNLPAQPIEVDDDTAAPLVEAGSLTPYRPGHWSEVVDPGTFSKLVAEHLPEGGTDGLREGDYAEAHAAASEAVAKAVENGEVQPVSLSEPKPRRSRRRNTD